VDTVAMESTGVYWIPLFELLDTRGFTVLLVNARHVKNVSGRKSDVLDCQWLQQLMTYGLLSGAFRPADQVCVLRSLSRQREMLLKSQARACAAHAKGAHADEHPAGQRHLRRGGRDRPEDSCAPSSPASATVRCWRR
jgi:transposase